MVSSTPPDLGSGSVAWGYTCLLQPRCRRHCRPPNCRCGTSTDVTTFFAIGAWRTTPHPWEPVLVAVPMVRSSGISNDWRLPLNQHGHVHSSVQEMLPCSEESLADYLQPYKPVLVTRYRSSTETSSILSVCDTCGICIILTPFLDHVHLSLGTDIHK